MNTAQIEALLPGLRDQIEAVLHVNVDDRAWARILGRIEDDLAASLDPKPRGADGAGGVGMSGQSVEKGQLRWVCAKCGAGVRFTDPPRSEPTHRVPDTCNDAAPVRMRSSPVFATTAEGA